GDVRGELLGELAPPEPAAPRRRVHLVDRDRTLERLRVSPGGEPRRVVPVVRRLEHDRGGARRLLGAKRDGIGLLAPVDVVLVALPRLRAVDGPLPDAGLGDGREGIDAGPPVVEVADHADGARVRRPDGEARAALDEVRAELLPQALVPTRPRQPDIEPAEGRLRSRAQTGTSSSSMRTIPATGICTQSGRLFSS